MVEQVAPGVFVATGFSGANVGLIETETGAVLIDAPWIPSEARAWCAQIAQLSPLGVAYVINTDYHLDHVLGTCYLPPAIPIAHELTWKYLRNLEREAALERALEMAPARAVELAVQLADAQVLLPEITVNGAMTLWCGNQRVDLLHFGGHTPATLGVYLPERRVLFSGDLVVNGCHPYAGDANSREWLAALQKIQALDIEVIVPGHGMPGGPEIIRPVYDYLSQMRLQIEACFEAGHTRRETVERVKPLDAFPMPPGEEEHQRRLIRSSVERIYDEVKKENTRGRKPSPK